MTRIRGLGYAQALCGEEEALNAGTNRFHWESFFARTHAKSAREVLAAVVHRVIKAIERF